MNSNNQQKPTKQPPPPNKIKILTTDEALQLAGNGHRYQSRIMCLMFFQILLGSFILVNNVFFFPDVQFTCIRTVPDSANLTISATEFCESSEVLLNQTDPLNNYTCTPLMPMTKSVTVSYSLYCQRGYYKDWIGYYLRVICWVIGLLFFANLQNNYSRVKLIRNGVLLLALLAIGLFFSFALLIFVILFFLCNFLEAGIFLTMLIYTMEICSENLRPITVSLYLMALALGQVILPVLLGIYCNWRVLGIFYMSPIMLILLIYMRVMVDGPRFLIVKKTFQEAKKSLEYLALMNDRIQELPKENEYKFEEEVKCQEMQGNLAKLLHIENQEIFSKPNKHNFFCLFKYNSLRVRSFIFLYFFAIFFLGINFAYHNYPEFTSDIYLNHMIHGFIKMFGFLIGGYLILNFQRKVVLKNLLFIAGVANILMIIYSFTYKFAIELIIINIIAQITFDAGVCLLIIYVTEVYPTVVRHYALGFFMAFGILMMIFGKLLFHLFEVIGVPAAVPLGVLCLLGIGVMNKLRETFGLGIRENLVEENDALLNNEILA